MKISVLVLGFLTACGASKFTAEDIERKQAALTMYSSEEKRCVTDSRGYSWTVYECPTACVVYEKTDGWDYYTCTQHQILPADENE